MITLTPSECRVVGVLVEKSLTTPAQYPLTLNAVVSGANQKSNRQPVMALSEDDAQLVLDQLIPKQLVREVMLSGSRVAKFRHVVREALDIGTPELVVLAELMLRGPQTVGEIRGRASRMYPLESMDIVRNVLDALAGREEPLVTRVAPLAGSRAERWGQLLAPTAHPLDAIPVSSAAAPAADAAPASSGGGGSRDGRPGDGGLDARVTALEGEVAALRAELEALRSLMPSADPDR